MPETIIIALIGVGGSAIGSFVGIVINSSLTQYRLKQLEEKVKEHNNIVTRTYELEKNMAVCDKRIDDIERSIV